MSLSSRLAVYPLPTHAGHTDFVDSARERRHRRHQRPGQSQAAESGDVVVAAARNALRGRSTRSEVSVGSQAPLQPHHLESVAAGVSGFIDAGAAAQSLDATTPDSVESLGSLSVSRSIVAAAKRGDPIEAGRLLMDAARDGRAPVQQDFDAVIIGCANIGDLDHAESWLNLMRLAEGVVSEELVRMMLKVLCARRRVGREEWPLSAKQISRWFLRLYREDRMPLSYHAVLRLLSFLAKEGKADEAELWVHCVAGRGVEPTHAMLELVIVACVNADDDERAIRWSDRVVSSVLRTLRESGGANDAAALNRLGIALPSDASPPANSGSE